MVSQCILNDTHRPVPDAFGFSSPPCTSASILCSVRATLLSHLHQGSFSIHLGLNKGEACMNTMAFPCVDLWVLGCMCGCIRAWTHGCVRVRGWVGSGGYMGWVIGV